MNRTCILSCRLWVLALLALFFLGCAMSPPAETGRAKSGPLLDSQEAQLPVRFQKPSYTIKDLEVQQAKIIGADTYIPAGIKFSSYTPLTLREVMKKLADFKGVTVSWASDVDQNVKVDVDIKEEDDFYGKIGDILRQHDYSFDLQHETIAVKYRVTKKFHIAMPFTASSFSTAVGGNVLGATGAGSLQGNVQLTSNNNPFDIWDNIRKNLDKVLDIWTDTTVAQATASSTTAAAASAQPPAAGGQAGAAKSQVVVPVSQATAAPAPAAAPAATATAGGATAATGAGKGYYTIDKPIGLLTVTAPQSLLKKVEDYVTNLKSELYRQISIEAKIVEVQLSDSSKLGIDWSSFLSDLSLNFTLLGGNNASPGIAARPGEIYPVSNRFVSTLSLGNSSGGSVFSVILNALKTQGDTNVLSNPRLSVINGQPAVLSVGKSVRYIDSVTTTISDSGIPSTSVTTASLMSGIGMGVIATVMDNNEIILTLTPVTSDLTEPIKERNLSGNVISLPEVKIREMNTVVRVKDGEMLVIGGLIQNVDNNEDKKTPFLGDVPVLGRLFGTSTSSTTKKELVIFLQPKIIS